MITGGSRALDSGNRRDLAADDRDEGMARELVRHGPGEALAIDGQRGAGRHAAGLGRAHDERAEPPHLFLEQADGVVELVAAEGVAADELREPIGLVDGRRAHGPHLVQRDRHALRRGLPRGFDPARPPPMISDHGRCWLVAVSVYGVSTSSSARVVAVLVVAEDLASVLLRGLLDEERRAARGTLLQDRAVPQHEIAVGIIRAAEERLAALRLALDDLAALVGVLRARQARRLVLDVLALGIFRAGGELAEAPLLDDQIRSAPRALLVENLVRLRRLEPALLGRDQLARRLALGIARAGEELAEAAALDGHRLAAVLARLDFLLAALRLRLGALDLARVRALRGTRCRRRTGRTCRP